VQTNLSYTAAAGSVRGMHYQLPPAAETKLVRCVAGAFYDVIVDMREDSPTYFQHFGVELSAANRRALYVPALFAHGFQTLADDTEASYQVSAFFTPGVERGLRHDDPVLGITWPLATTVISDKDQSWPLLDSGRARRPA
jgi:dTDP-4-dehydrorhamnose 3,5-epimerase